MLPSRTGGSGVQLSGLGVKQDPATQYPESQTWPQLPQFLGLLRRLRQMPPHWSPIQPQLPLPLLQVMKSQRHIPQYRMEWSARDSPFGLGWARSSTCTTVIVVLLGEIEAVESRCQAVRSALTQSIPTETSAHGVLSLVEDVSTLARGRNIGEITGLRDTSDTGLYIASAFSSNNCRHVRMHPQSHPTNS